MIKALLLGHLTWNIPLLILLTSITIGYVLIILRYKPISLLQSSLFLLGICLLYFSIGSPLLAISYLSFSFHMIQMSILYFIVPPLILLGIPSPIHNRITTIRPVLIVNRIYKPKLSLILFATLFLMYHLPIFLTFITKYSILQNSFLTVLFLLAFHMWIPIATPHAKQKLSKLKKNKYVFHSGLLITPACLLFIVTALFNNHENPLFAEMLIHLCLPPETSSIQLLPPPFNTKYDQMMAGVFMMGLHKFGLIIICKLEEKCIKNQSS